MSCPTVVGADIGHSAVKLSYGANQRLLFRSLAVPAVPISDEAEAARAALETVEIGNRHWFLGRTAEIQCGGAIASGLSDNWIESPEHCALLKGSLLMLEREGVALDASSLLVLGLPVTLHRNQAGRLKEIAREYTAAEVKVVPQPMGPYHHVMLDSLGRPAADRSLADESWAVVDVGYYTTDFLLMMDGRWVEKASGDAHGVHLAAEHLQRTLAGKGIEVDLPDCEAAMSSRQVMCFGMKDVGAEVDEAASLVVSEVVDKAQRLLTPYVRKLAGVVLAGGGAPLVAAALKNVWPNVHLPSEPRFAVAEGFRRLGEGIILSRYAAGGAL